MLGCRGEGMGVMVTWGQLHHVPRREHPRGRRGLRVHHHVGMGRHVNRESAGLVVRKLGRTPHHVDDGWVVRRAPRCLGQQGGRRPHHLAELGT